MVHNGIEYGDMQLIAEAYDLLHRGAGLTAAELADIFAEWNAGELQSYLIEITARSCRSWTTMARQPLVDLIVDEAQQKGTGKWMSQNAFDLGAPIPTINAAVEARVLSALKNERVAASQVLAGPPAKFTGNRERLDCRGATGALRQQDHVCTRREWRSCASRRPIPLRHRSGRSRQDLARRLHHPRRAPRRHPRRVPARPGLVNLLLDKAFRDAIGATGGQDGWRFVVQTAVGLGIPCRASASRSPTTMPIAARACRRT